MTYSLSQKLSAEALGSLLLAGVVIGSGILAERLAMGNAAVALTGNTLATVAALGVLIYALGPISGAHFNPAVSLVMALRRDLTWREFALYVPTQVAAMIAGAALAHAMFGLPLLQTSTKLRSSVGEGIGEFVATFWLLFAILFSSNRSSLAPVFAVPAAITAGLLVYLIDLVCESGHQWCARAHRHVRWRRATERSGVHRCAVGRGAFRAGGLSILC